MKRFSPSLTFDGATNDAIRKIVESAFVLFVSFVVIRTLIPPAVLIFRPVLVTPQSTIW